VRKIAVLWLFAVGLPVLLLGGCIAASYMIHGVPPNEPEEATLMKTAAITLIFVGGAICATAGLCLVGKHP
jgi:hypothetical protein